MFPAPDPAGVPPTRRASHPLVRAVPHRLTGAFFACLAIALAACGGGPDDPEPVDPGPDIVTASVEVSPASSMLQLPDGVVQLQAVARNRAGDPLQGKAFTWASSAPAVAAVDAAGRVTAASVGAASITAATEGHSGSASITVTGVPVASVEVSPAAATLVVGAMLQLAAQPRDASGNALNDRAVSWTSASPNVAEVNATGLVTARADGSAMVTASSEGRAGHAAIQVVSTPVTGDLACGRLIAGSISAAAEVDVITFGASAGTTILLTLTQTTAGFNNLVHARATVLTPSGEQLLVFDSNAQRTLTLAQAGTYTVRINASNLVTTGSYAIGLECLRPAAAVDVALEPGVLIPDIIAAPAEVDLYTLDAQAGERVLVTVTQTTAGFNNLVHARTTVLSPSGVPVLTFDSNAQRTITFGESGRWVFYVNASNLFTSGQYALGIESLAPIGPTDGALSPGSLVPAEISSPAEVDLYTFEGTQGQRILLTATQTTAGFNNLVHARVSVITPSGTVLVTFDSNAQRTLTLPASGTYLLQVNASNLFTAGSYNLGLESLAPLGPVDGTLAVGGLISATIASPAEVDVYTFDGQAGASTLLTLAQTSGFNNLVHARGTVLSPSGTSLVVFDSNGQRTVTLPETGTYTIYINASNLFTAGSYTIGRQ